MNTPSSNAAPRPLSRLLARLLPDALILPSVALLLSAVMTWANVGFGELFFAQWGRSFITSLVVLPMILVSLGALDRLVDATLVNLHWVGRKLVTSLLTAVVIESVLALAITAINTPWGSTFGHAWWIAFSRSMPVGVLIGLFMGFYMKPKMDRMRQSAKATQT